MRWIYIMHTDRMHRQLRMHECVCVRMHVPAPDMTFASEGAGAGAFTANASAQLGTRIHTIASTSADSPSILTYLWAAVPVRALASRPRRHRCLDLALSSSMPFGTALMVSNLLLFKLFHTCDWLCFFHINVISSQSHSFSDLFHKSICVNS